MAFRVSELNMGKPKRIWMPVDATDTLYAGQIVKSTSDGVAPLGAASGAADTTGEGIPFGIVVGDNYRDKTYNSTWLANSITGVTASSSQDDLEKVGGHGAMNPPGDSQAKVEIDLIDPSTVIAGPIYNAAYGTAPTEVTVTAASADGCITAPTTGACDFTPVADLCTIFARSGANANTGRITTDTSTTEPTVTHGFPTAAVAVGDVFVRVPLRMGVSYGQTDSESMYIDCSATPATDYWVLMVVELDLRESGKEEVHFRFGADHFTTVTG